MNSNLGTVVPTPLCTFQGAYLSLIEVDLKLGPFNLKTQPGLGFGHSVDQATLDGVPVTTLRSAQCKLEVTDNDPATSEMALGYKQNGTQWMMAFTVSSDPKGGLVGTSFALDVQSSYQDLPMSIGRMDINQPKLVVQTVGLLPADYIAQLRLRFWTSKPDELPLDAWLSLQLGYIKNPQSPTLAAAIASGDLSREDLVTTYELIYYPATGLSRTAPVLGDNYPALDRYHHS